MKLFQLKDNANKYNSPLGITHCKWNGSATFTFGNLDRNGTLNYGLYLEGKEGNCSTRVHFGSMNNSCLTPDESQYIRSKQMVSKMYANKNGGYTVEKTKVVGGGCTPEEAEAFVHKCFNEFNTLSKNLVMYKGRWVKNA